VGGVSLENITAFIHAGAFAVGVGAYVENPSLAKKKDFSTIRQRAEQFITLAQTR
jgi:2-keto-3-deoxy-6-phosphogluconate aldolase